MVETTHEENETKTATIVLHCVIVWSILFDLAN